MTVGDTSPLRRYPRGHLLLDTLLLTFLVKEKSVPVWAAWAHKTKSLMQLCFEEEARNLAPYFEPKSHQTFSLWSSALHTAVSFLSRGKIRKACLRGHPLDIPGGCAPAVTASGHAPPMSITKVWCITGGIEGGPPPSAGNPKTRRFLVYLCLLSLHKKVGAVWSA